MNAASVSAAELLALRATFERISTEVKELTSERYVELEQEEIDPALLKVAAAVARLCAADLGLPVVPKIRWFREETEAERAYRKRWGSADWHFFLSDRPIWGRACRADGGEIWVKAGLSLWDTIATVAHECKHLRQVSYKLLAGLTTLDCQLREDEDDAEAYAQAIVALLQE